MAERKCAYQGCTAAAILLTCTMRDVVLGQWREDDATQLCREHFYEVLEFALYDEGPHVPFMVAPLKADS